MDWEAVTAELRRDLDQRHVKPPRQFGPKGHYIEAWHAQAEANRIFGHDGWHQEVTETRCVMEKPRKIGRDQKDGWGVTYTAKVRILVDGVCREDFGAGHGYDLDLGLAHESAIKEAVSDAMKRAMKSFGWPFGLALYDKDKAHVGSGEDRPVVHRPDGSQALNADFAHEPEPKAPQHDKATEFRTRANAAQSDEGLMIVWNDMIAHQGSAAAVPAEWRDWINKRKKQLREQMAEDMA